AVEWRGTRERSGGRVDDLAGPTRCRAIALCPPVGSRPVRCRGRGSGSVCSLLAFTPAGARSGGLPLCLGEALRLGLAAWPATAGPEGARCRPARGRPPGELVRRLPGR